MLVRAALAMNFEKAQPRPLGDANLTQIEGLVCDLDDTLTRDGTLELEAVDALHRARQVGMRLLLVSGRPLGWTDVLARLLPVDAAIGENGAGWAYRNGRMLELGYYHDEATREHHRRQLSEVRERVRADLPEVRCASDQEARRCDLAFDVGEEVDCDETTVKEIAEIIEEFGLRATVSTVHVHAIPGEWDKASGTEKAFRDVFGTELPYERFAFVGDSPNDESAFASFPCSIGVANVRPFLPQLMHAPKFITQKDRGRGFAEVVDAVVGSRSRKT